MLKKVPRVRSRQAKSPAPPRRFNHLGTLVGQAFSLPEPGSLEPLSARLHRPKVPVEPRQRLPNHRLRKRGVSSLNY